MNLENFPYTMSFSSEIKVLYPEEKDKYIAQASLEKIKSIVPELNSLNDITLFPIASNAFICGMVNKNDDVINKETTLKIYDSFIKNPINVEHKRDRCVGVILSAGFSEFGTDKILTKEDVEDLEEGTPFNICIGGVLWRIVSPKLINLIEESCDPTSDSFGDYSYSWELGFKNFNCVLLGKENKTLENSTIITGKEVDKCKEYLKAFGGNGTYNGKRIVRMPTGTVIPLGVALTARPAAAVKGLITASEQFMTKSNIDSKSEFSENLDHLPATWEEYNKDFDSIDPKDHDCDIGDETPQSDSEIKAKVAQIVNAYKELKDGEINKEEFTKKTGIEITFAMKLAKHFIKKYKNEKNITQSAKSSVTKREDIMKFNSIEDITDENLKQASASVISEFIKSELTKASTKWEQEKKDKDNQISEAKTSIANTVKELGDIKASLAALNKEREDRVKLDDFNTRMSEIDASYTLDDETRSALVDDIKALASDEDYQKYKVKIGKILKAYKKSKSQKDSDEQQALYREDNMNAKKKDGKDKKDVKKDEKAEASNQIGEDNKSPGQNGNDDLEGPGTDSDNQFVNRDGKNVNPHDGENNGEHPNQIAKDNWNKSVAGKVTGKSAENDGGQNAGASIIEAALENAEKIDQHIPNTSSSKPQSMKEKYAQMFASSIEVNGKKLVL